MKFLILLLLIGVGMYFYLQNGGDTTKMVDDIKDTAQEQVEDLKDKAQEALDR